MFDSPLAWQLAEAARDDLAIDERNDVYIAIATGDVFWALVFLLNTIVQSGRAVPVHLADDLERWISAYRDHPDEPRLRNLVSQLKVGVDEPAAPPTRRFLATTTQSRPKARSCSRL